MSNRKLTTSKQDQYSMFWQTSSIVILEFFKQTCCSKLSHMTSFHSSWFIPAQRPSHYYHYHHTNWYCCYRYHYLYFCHYWHMINPISLLSVLSLFQLRGLHLRLWEDKDEHSGPQSDLRDIPHRWQLCQILASVSKFFFSSLSQNLFSRTCNRGVCADGCLDQEVRRHDDDCCHDYHHHHRHSNI